MVSMILIITFKWCSSFLQESYVLSCLAGFTEHVTGCHKLSVNHYTVTQPQLMDKCSTDYGHTVHLIALETEEEKNHVKQMITNSGIYCVGIDKSSFTLSV